MTQTQMKKWMKKQVETARQSHQSEAHAVADWMESVAESCPPGELSPGLVISGLEELEQWAREIRRALGTFVTAQSKLKGG